MADARATQLVQIRHSRNSAGTVSDWNDEAIAFYYPLAVYAANICGSNLSQIRFQRRLNDNCASCSRVIAWHHDFAECIYDYSGMRTENHESTSLQSADIGRKVMPLPSTRFGAFGLRALRRYWPRTLRSESMDMVQPRLTIPFLHG